MAVGLLLVLFLSWLFICSFRKRSRFLAIHVQQHHFHSARGLRNTYEEVVFMADLFTSCYALDSQQVSEYVYHVSLLYDPLS